MKDDSERLLLLEEAVNLHNSGCYYGATSIMMCQVDGLICDISNYTDENGLICSEDDEKEICELYQIDFQNHKKFAKTSEKAYDFEVGCNDRKCCLLLGSND